MKSAILFIVFNRPDTTQKVFEAIRQARPPRLYVAADAPRAGKNEEAACEEVRRIATAIDWPCEIHTLFQSTNQGCRIGVSSGITWFLDKEGEGIVLEDDTVPNQDFFPYCEELLERYRHDVRVSAVAGTNFNYPTGLPDYSYFFSKNMAIWGWATWKRAWDKVGTYRRHREEVFKANGVLEVIHPDRYEYIVNKRSLVEAETGKLNTWDFEFQLDSLLHGSLFIIPTRNMVVNLGFGEQSTHTSDQDSYFGRLIHEPMGFPLKHPEYLVRSKVYEDHKFYMAQRLDELLSYRDFLKLLWNKTLKKIRGVRNIDLPE